MTPAPSRPWAIVLLATLIAGVSLSSAAIFVAAIPDMAVDFGTSVGRIQASLATFLAGNVAGQLMAGPISDYFGRRRVLLWGVALWMLASTALAVTTNIDLFIGIRVFQAIGAAAGMTMARAVVRDLYGRAEGARAMSLVMFAISVAPIMAPAIGGYIHVYLGWRATFWVMAGSGVVLGLWAWLRFPETNTDTRVQSNVLGAMIADYRTLLGSPAFLAFAGTLAATYGAWYLFVADGAVLFNTELGIKPEQFGTIMALAALGFLPGSLVSNRLTVRVGLERMIGVGLAICLAAVGLFAAAAFLGSVNVIVLVAAQTLISFGQGFSAPNINAGAIHVFPRMAGAATGLLGAMQIGGAIVATLIVIIVAPETLVTFALVQLGFVASAAICWMALGRFVRRSPSTG